MLSVRNMGTLVQGNNGLELEMIDGGYLEGCSSNGIPLECIILNNAGRTMTMPISFICKNGYSEVSVS